MKKTFILLFIITFAFWACEKKNTLGSAEIDSIVLSPIRNILKPGQSVQLSALVIDKSNNSVDVEVTWTTDNDAVATVTKEGLVTAVDQGEAKIFATVEDKQGVAEILVSINRRRILSELFTSST